MAEPIKPGPNKAWMKAEQDRRKSSAASKHRNKKKFYRPSEKRKIDRDG